MRIIVLHGSSKRKARVRDCNLISNRGKSLRLLSGTYPAEILKIKRFGLKTKKSNRINYRFNLCSQVSNKRFSSDGLISRNFWIGFGFWINT